MAGELFKKRLEACTTVDEVYHCTPYLADGMPTELASVYKAKQLGISLPLWAIYEKSRSFSEAGKKNTNFSEFPSVEELLGLDEDQIYNILMVCISGYLKKTLEELWRK